MAFFDEGAREKFHKLANGYDGQFVWDPVISIGTAAKKLNLSASALRKYEREGLLIYHRTPSGRRLLSRADIERIQAIQHLLGDVGLNIEGIRRLLALLPCWTLKPCGNKCTPAKAKACAALTDCQVPCWMQESHLCAASAEDCRQCDVYRFGAFCTEAIKELIYSNDVTGTIEDE